MAGAPESHDEPRRWFTLKQFYADETRRRSEERSFGTYWQDAERGWQCEVSWLRATGELIAVAPRGDVTDTGWLSGSIDLAAGLVEVALSAAAHRKSESQGLPEVEVVAVIRDEPTLDALLEGWEEHRADTDGIGWLRTRVATLQD